LEGEGVEVALERLSYFLDQHLQVDMLHFLQFGVELKRIKNVFFGQIDGLELGADQVVDVPHFLESLLGVSIPRVLHVVLKGSEQICHLFDGLDSLLDLGIDHQLADLLLVADHDMVHVLHLQQHALLGLVLYRSEEHLQQLPCLHMVLDSHLIVTTQPCRNLKVNLSLQSGIKKNDVFETEQETFGLRGE
jgi:hypothetical protein